MSGNTYALLLHVTLGAATVGVAIGHGDRREQEKAVGWTEA